MADGPHVQQLMGIGTRYDFSSRSGPRLSVVVHKDGHRELYAVEPGAEEPAAVLFLSEEQARLVGAVLSGTYFGSP